MSVLPVTEATRRFWRVSPWDSLLVALALGHGLLLLAVPAWPVVALGLWWNSNTVSHYFLHRPFFVSPLLNRLFALYLSVLLGIPQRLWRDRHLAHHADVAPRLRWSRPLVVETGAVLLLWVVLFLWSPTLLLTVYLPGYLIGLALCHIHGHFEHAPGTTSHHGRVYNMLFFNDGYHVEHHAHPNEHWTRLRRHVVTATATSRWPAVLRWLDWLSLDGLEHLVLRSSWLQRFVLQRHERALRTLLPEHALSRIVIVGGALFPRTLLVLQRLYPQAEFTVVDGNAAHLTTARPLVSGSVRWVEGWFTPETTPPCDLLVIPLAYQGDRQALYQKPAAPIVLIHDWIWQRQGRGTVISWLLLKRLNRLDS